MNPQLASRDEYLQARFHARTAVQALARGYGQLDPMQASVAASDVLLGSVDADINLRARLLEDDDSRLVSRILPAALLDIAVMGFASLTVAEAKDRRRKVSKPILPRQLRELPMPRRRYLPSCRARFFHRLVDVVSACDQLRATFPAKEFLSALGLHQQFALLDGQRFVAPLDEMNRRITEQEELGNGLQFDGVDPRGRDGQELVSSLKKRPSD